VCAVLGVVALAGVIACGNVSPDRKGNQPDGGGQPGCHNSLDCTGGLICDSSIAQCVECVSATDCPANNDCTARKCVPFVPCKNSLECTSAQVCDTAGGRCVACLTDADCADATKTCVAKSCRLKCASDLACTPLGLLCDKASGSCVVCIVSTDCPAGQYCQANACQAAVCSPGHTSCMLNAIATCNSVGDGYTGTAVPCDPKVCTSGASGAACVDATPDGGAGGSSGRGGAGGTTGAGGSGPGAGGAGGTAGGGGGGGSGGCGLVIDDMEADTGIICQGEGRIGHWFAYDDGMPGTTQTPPPGVAPIRPDPIQPPRGASNFAMHTSGTVEMYAAIGCSLNGSTSDVMEVPRMYDVSRYTGISFYAKGTPAMLQVIVANTDDVAPMYGGTCPGSCVSNHAIISLQPTQWTFYQVPFSQLASGDFTFNPAHVLTIDFQAQPSTGVRPFALDLWIDDLSFY
jgi:hypothetical protein